MKDQKYTAQCTVPHQGDCLFPFFRSPESESGNLQISSASVCERSYFCLCKMCFVYLCVMYTEQYPELGCHQRTSGWAAPATCDLQAR